MSDAIDHNRAANTTTDTLKGPKLSIPALGKKIGCSPSTVRNMIADGMEYRWKGKRRVSTYAAYLKWDAEQKLKDPLVNEPNTDEADEADYLDAIETLKQFGVKMQSRLKPQPAG